MSNEAARWLKKMREKEGLSYRELGKAVKLSHTTISKAEEQGDATAETWMILADHYKESALKVLYWAKKMKYPPSDQDIVTELQNQVIIKILQQYPKGEWESVLKTVVNNLEWMHQSKSKNNEAQGRKNP